VSFGHQYTPEVGHLWLRRITLLGIILILAMCGYLVGVLPGWVFVLSFLPFAGCALWAILDVTWPLLQDHPPALAEDPGPPEVRELQVWRDPTAPDELVRITKVRPGSVLIERIAGSSLATFHKLFPVSANELSARFDLLRCHKCAEPSGALHAGGCPYCRTAYPLVEIGHCISDERMQELRERVLAVLEFGKSLTTGFVVQEMRGTSEEEIRPVLNDLLTEKKVIQPNGAGTWGIL
jgi:hypothetical protein